MHGLLSEAETKKESSVSEKQKMSEYLSLWKEACKYERAMRWNSDMLSSCEKRLVSIRDELAKTVQPNCGSATLPSRRVYVDGQYTVLIVEWDNKSGRACVGVHEPEK